MRSQALIEPASLGTHATFHTHQPRAPCEPHTHTSPGPDVILAWQAFNLKAAIEYQMKNYEAAQEALSDMPPRAEDELDPVSLHNSALMHMDNEPASGFRKLNFLISNPPFPPETFVNLMLLYCKHQYYDLAADVLAENAHLTFQYLSPDLYEFLDATLMVQVCSVSM